MQRHSHRDRGQMKAIEDVVISDAWVAAIRCMENSPSGPPKLVVEVGIGGVCAEFCSQWNGLKAVAQSFNKMWSIGLSLPLSYWCVAIYE